MNALRGRPARLAVPALLVIVVGVVAFLAVRALRPSGAESTASDFASAWQAADLNAAGAATDDPRAATAALRANRAGLDNARLRAEVINLREDGDSARAQLRLSWDVPSIGRFAYRTTAPLRRTDGEWKVAWSPAVVHPALREETSTLGTVRLALERGAIRDRDGRALVTARPVKRVGVVAGKVRDPRAAAAALAGALDVDAKPLERQIRGGGPKQFVEAIALRTDDFRDVEGRLRDIPGLLVVDGEQQLAPTRAFARALLGGVAPATAEQLKALGGAYASGDDVGQSGLQRRFERTLAPTPTRRVVVREGGVPTRTLLERRGRAGRALRTTLSTRVQNAAESALGGRSDEAALVALQPSSGDVLAVANRPVDSTYDRALEGNYPPGSTFKVVSTSALLDAGLQPQNPVACPRTLEVDGRSFRNFEGGGGTNPPFSTDFAESCNTAFVSLAPRLRGGALSEAAQPFGFDQNLSLPVTAAKSQVPDGRTPVERAASMIGQARILASPLVMAGVAATVADGRWRAPRLVSTDRARALEPLPEGRAAELRGLMRGVVTSGSGTALAGVPGEPAGKSGTAEFGGGDPPPTHAWFIAFRGDVAVAVLVERGKAGGTVAAPIAARFFEALGG